MERIIQKVPNATFIHIASDARLDWWQTPNYATPPRTPHPTHSRISNELRNVAGAHSMQFEASTKVSMHGPDTAIAALSRYI
ncbi:hypothetical protein MMC30_007350 [Trapelia coarctata]|nr:hypothetical protein [Trapelia coarctata]